MRATLRRRLHELYAEIATGSIVRVRELLQREPDLTRAAKETPPPCTGRSITTVCGSRNFCSMPEPTSELRDPDRDARPLEYAIVYARKQIIRVLVAHGAGARNGLGTALKGAGGAFEEFPELPSRRSSASCWRPRVRRSTGNAPVMPGSGRQATPPVAAQSRNTT